MTQTFVQTDRHVIDVSKIAYVETYHRASVTVHFSDGAKLSLPRVEAATLLDAIAGLARQGHCRAIRAAAATGER